MFLDFHFGSFVYFLDIFVDGQAVDCIFVDCPNKGIQRANNKKLLEIIKGNGVDFEYHDPGEEHIDIVNSSLNHKYISECCSVIPKSTSFDQYF